MEVITRELTFSTSPDGGMVDVTSKIEEELKKTGIKEGIVTVFVPGATGAVSTIEYEPGLLKDFPAMLERIAPSDIHYHHHETWGCDNGRSHVRATLIGPSLTVPFKNSKLLLGTWQQVVFIELDTRPRQRRLILQFIGK